MSLLTVQEKDLSDSITSSIGHQPNTEASPVRLVQSSDNFMILYDSPTDHTRIDKFIAETMCNSLSGRG